MKGVFAVCTRDAERHLPAVLANLAGMATVYAEAAFIFVENDSNDGTKGILNRWCEMRPNAHLISEDGIARRLPPRTVRLAWARNQYLARVRSTFAGFDHMIVADGDEVSTAPVDLDAFRRALAFLNAAPGRAAVFANQRGVYYDLWALRHKKLCPGDIWEQTFDAARRNGLSDDEAYARVFAPRIFCLDPAKSSVRVESAFGGLGIYRISSALKNPRTYEGHKIKAVRQTDKVARVGWQACEHVAFHEGFAASGQALFIMPGLINATTGPVATFNRSFWRSLAFDPGSFAPP